MGEVKPTAHVRLVDGIHYRRDAFEAGFEALGYSLLRSPTSEPRKGDVLTLWNRYARDEHIARAYEEAGGYVLVTENAPLGPEEKPSHLFSIYLGHHNGAGVWHIGNEPRWYPELQPWRSNGSVVLILRQRGMGEPGIREEKGWFSAVLSTLQRMTRRPIMIREHPGPRPHHEIDWTDVWCGLTWASAAGLKAIVAGVPVFYCFPKWVGAGAARFFPGDLENPYMGDRTQMMHRLSWAMWSAEEIASGEPFRLNLRPELAHGYSSSNQVQQEARTG